MDLVFKATSGFLLGDKSPKGKYFLRPGASLWNLLLLLLFSTI